MKKFKFSWVVLGTIIYSASVALYALADNSTVWDDYFNFCSLGLSVFLGLCIFKKKWTNIETQGVTLIISYKIFCILYFVTGTLLNKRTWMEQNEFFVISMGLSAFVAWFVTCIRKRKNHELQTD